MILALIVGLAVLALFAVIFVMWIRHRLSAVQFLILGIGLAAVFEITRSASAGLDSGVLVFLVVLLIGGGLLVAFQVTHTSNLLDLVRFMNRRHRRRNHT